MLALISMFFSKWDGSTFYDAYPSFAHTERLTAGGWRKCPEGISCEAVSRLMGGVGFALRRPPADEWSEAKPMTAHRVHKPHRCFCRYQTTNSFAAKTMERLQYSFSIKGVSWFVLLGAGLCTIRLLGDNRAYCKSESLRHSE